MCVCLVLIVRGRSFYQGLSSGFQCGTTLGLRTRRPEEAACLHRMLAADGLGVGALDPTRAVGGALNVGDTVVYSKYGGTEITDGGEDVLILNGRDILAIVK